MVLASSYDSNLRYGAQTPFSDQLAFHWAGSLWQYDAHHDSILTVGNGGTKPAQALLTLYYNEGAGKYQMERTLEPGDQMWVDVGDLVREHAPDINGSILPATVTHGSYEIRELGTGVGTLFEGKVVFDKTYGEVTYGCAACCAYKPALIRLFYNPLGIPYGLQADQGIEAWDTCSDLWEDITLDLFGTWATGNTGIATVDAVGTHTGVAVGSTTTYTGPTDEQVQTLWNKCPIMPVGPSGGDNVIKLVLQGNPYASIFVGTDPNLAAANSIFATVSPTGGTFTESSSASGDTFTNVTSGGPGWVVHTTTQSATPGDRMITVTYSVSGEGQVSRSLQVTARQFAYATNDNPRNLCSGYGYDYTYTYTPYTHPGNNQAVQAGIGVTDTAVAESFNPTSTNCAKDTGSGALDANSNFRDHIQYCAVQPPPQCSWSTTQTITVGGFLVRTNSLKFTDTGFTYQNNGPTQ